MSRFILTLIVLFSCACLVSEAQNNMYSLVVPTASNNDSEGVFKHMDMSLNVGSTGLGLELASPIGRYLNLRTGFDYMPHISVKTKFSIQVGEHGNAADFEKMSGLLSDFTGGEKVKPSVDMIGQPRFNHFKLLVDFMPLKNKNWHLTAGFYLGSSRVATAYNTTEDMVSLVGVGIYNNFYDKAVNEEPIFNKWGIELPPDVNESIKEKGRMGVHLGNYCKDIYYKEGEVYYNRSKPNKELITVEDAEGNEIPVINNEYVVQASDKLIKHKKGDAYMIEPNEKRMVTANVKANRLKPYLGFGYSGALSKNDDRYKISVDCGVLFWGGTPDLITHDGTNLTKDVSNIGGKVGDYVKLIKAVKAYPAINLRFTRRLF